MFSSSDPDVTKSPAKEQSRSLKTIKLPAEIVNKGQVIGYEGSTGASTGPHVHFMVLVNNIWVDPTKYVQLP